MTVAICLIKGRMYYNVEQVSFRNNYKTHLAQYMESHSMQELQRNTVMVFFTLE